LVAGVTELDAFVARLARRIASFPADADAIRADARRFHQLVVSDTAQTRTATLFAEGLQTLREPLELNLGDRLGAVGRDATLRKNPSLVDIVAGRIQ
jgi:hypothetical protein